MRWCLRLAVIVLVLVVGAAEGAYGPLGDEQRISFMGPNGDPNYDADSPSVAYNTVANEYLVVWVGDDSTPPLVKNEDEIFAQRLSASGAPLGGPARVSHQGANGDTLTEADNPRVAFNAATNNYLVVWEGELGPDTDEFEIWGQLLDAAGVEIGDDFQISDMGPDNDKHYDAFGPAVAANSSNGEYLVVWQGNDVGELEVYGQRVSATGAFPGTNDFRISEQGMNGNPASGVLEPAVAYNSNANEYLVAWPGEIAITDDFEIWGQLLSAGGTEVGGNDFQISTMGSDGDPRYVAADPRIASNPANGDYLVVWSGDDDTVPLVDDELEIFGQRLTALGAQTGADDFRISHQGADGDPGVGAEEPAIAYDAGRAEYLVGWAGGSLLAREVYMQRVDAGGAPAAPGFQVSAMGPDANVRRADVAVNPGAGAALVVWHGVLGVDEEIFGRWLGVAAPILLTTDPAGPANDNAPRVKGNVDPESTIDVFKNSRCLGAPAVNDAPGSALNGVGVPVPVADNSITEFSATASSDGRTSRCSNSIAYEELTPPVAPSPPPPPAADTTPPVVASFRADPGRFRVADAGAAPKGSHFRFQLSEPALARILIERALPGRRAGKRCVAPSAKLREGRRCTRYKRTATLTYRNRPAGANAIRFRGRIGRRPLARAAYRATITASDAAGNRSMPKRTGFKIVRR